MRCAIIKKAYTTFACDYRITFLFETMLLHSENAHLFVTRAPAIQRYIGDILVCNSLDNHSAVSVPFSQITDMKDFFSDQAKLYATFRPHYPDELFQFILRHVPQRNLAWDCATGNGQVAQYLSPYFKKIIATDISQQQLENAHHASNIEYIRMPAEKTSFANDQFDLITVGQALHWFNLPEFYKEVTRVGKNNAIIAVWGYNLCNIDPEIDAMTRHFYHHVVGTYWDSARRHVEDEYAHLDFPFERIEAPVFAMRTQWNLDQFTGYLSTWSATQQYIKIKQTSPVFALKEKLKSLWTANEKKIVNFPVFLKLGVIHKQS